MLAPVNTATPQPELTPTSTVTPTASPVPTPASRETVSMYSAAHRTLDRGEFKDAERRFRRLSRSSRNLHAHGQGADKRA